MPEVNKILVAICFSEYCGGTFAYAARLAEQLQAELIVANVIDAKDVKAISKIESMGYSISAKDYVEGVKEERKAELKKMIAKGQSDHPRLLPGSVAEKMFRHSPVSVVFYKKK